MHLFKFSKPKGNIQISVALKKCPNICFAAKLFEQSLGSPSHIIKLEVCAAHVFCLFALLASKATILKTTILMILRYKVSNGVMRSRLLARGNFDDKGEEVKAPT